VVVVNPAVNAPVQIVLVRLANASCNHGNCLLCKLVCLENAINNQKKVLVYVLGEKASILKMKVQRLLFKSFKPCFY